MMSRMLYIELLCLLLCQLFFGMNMVSLLPRNRLSSQSPISEFPSPSLAKAGLQTLLIDNYDSYTYNLFQLISDINGVEPHVIYNNAFQDWSEVTRCLSSFDNIVISPGPGHPSNPLDFGLCDSAIHCADIPILGVCLGHQGLVTSNGGQVVKAPIPMHGRLSSVYHTGSDIFRGVHNGSEVVRYHSLVAQTPLPINLEVTAWTEENIVMGLKHKHKPHYGVQFHPESIKTTIGRRILENFINLSFNHRKQAIHFIPPPVFKPSKVSTIQPDYSTNEIKLQKKSVFIHPVFANSTTMSTMDVFEQLYGNYSTSFFLDSDCTGPTHSYPSPIPSSSSMSYMGVINSPQSFIVEFKDINELVVRKTGVDRNDLLVERNQSVLSFLKEQIESSKDAITDVSLGDNVCSLEDCKESLPHLNGLLHGGMFGYFSYELGQEIEKTLKISRFNKSDDEDADKLKMDTSVPLAVLLYPSTFLAYDHESKTYFAIGIHSTGYDSGANSNDREEIRLAAKKLALRVSTAISQVARPRDDEARDKPKANSVLSAWKSKKAYKDDIAECLRHISNGDTYEVCLTVQFQGPLEQSKANSNKCTALETYRKLRYFNPAPYATFMKYHYGDDSRNEEGFAVCCSSPERYLKIDENAVITSKPIKGTARRNLLDVTKDQIIAKELHMSEKSQAENLMITDLVRNDLGRVCEIGTVTVPCLMNIESYATVHQMVSTIQGKLRKGYNAVDALAATFPGGSMTGAPKLRTMQIIRTLEPKPRGVYSGSIGYISMKGTMDMNIVIRTALLRNKTITIGAGGAIVALSDPEEEVEEVLLKARAVGKALGYNVVFPDQ